MDCFAVPNIDTELIVQISIAGSLDASDQAEEKSAVAVQNSLNAVTQALEEGMAIQ